MEHTVAKGARLSRGGSRAPATTRYQLKGELARGGMGVVHRAVDLVTGREVALKRLLERSERGNVLALFEREFRTLRSLRHPRIIEVYDYGVADGAAYYTMELLSGTDLGKLAPLPYRQACAHLRDLASSLALLQARRLVHRDVSPRNARVTADGRCKLLDFGALTGFGVPTQVVGTPPCIPPEVVRGAALDQRADLYSLGATAYFVLTGRHAYPVRSIAELNHAWTQAIPQPSQYASDIPPALDALVMSLLHHDPLARPESAAEVIDRLGVIGELASDLEPQAEASYFFSTELIGRKEQLKRAQDMLRAATEGEGSALLFRGLPGTGRTRLLSEVCVQAQLAGATVLQVDAQQERGENSVAVALLAKLLDAASDDVLRAAKPHASVLGSLLPQLAGKLSVEGNHQRPEAPGEWRGQVLSACLGWLSSVAKVRPVVVAVDNLDVVDDASTALLAALAAEAKSASLMVVGTLLSGAEPATSGVRFLLEHGKSIELLALSAEQTGALARAIFGEVPNVMRLGEWLHRTSGGIASHCLELASELRRSGAVSYAGGTWVLPDDAQLASLPRGMTEAMQARLRHLSPAALTLAQALSVHGSPLEVSTCRLVSDEIGLSDMFALLDELVGNDVLAIAGDRYRFRQEGLRSLLLSENEPARVARLHGVMADALLGTTYADDRMVRVEAGWHMLRSGQELRGAQLLASAALAFEIGTGSLQAAVPALEEARRVFLQERRSLYELLPTVTRLAAEGYYSDRRLSTRYAEEAFGLLRRATGLSLADRLQPMLGGNIAVRLGLAVAALRFYLTPRARRPASFSDVFVLMVNCVTTQAGAGTVCLDTEATRRAAEFMQPLKRLGPDHMLSAIADYCTLLMKMTQEQQPEVHAGWIKLLERLSDPAQFSDLPDYVRQLYRGGALFALGIVETWHDGDEALVRAQELESLGLRIYDRAAQQIRMLYHAGRGELDRAEDYRRKMEIHAIQTGAAWQVDVTLPLTSSVIYGPLGDLVRIKRASEQIEQLATRYEVAALARTARAAYGSYLLWRGSPDKARSVLEPIVCGTEPRSYVGWSRSLAVIADAYNREGLHAEALRLCEHGLAHVRPEDRRFVRMFLGLEVQRALAKAGLGDLVEAEAELMDLLAEHQSFENPVTLGAIREALAQVAVLSEDSEAFMEHAAAVEALYRPTRVPSLIARAEKLGRRGAQTLGLPARGVGGFSVVRSPAESVSLELSKCSTADARHTRALQLLLESSRCREGHLFLVEGSTPRLVASSEGPPAATLEQQAAVLASRLREDSETYMGATQGTLAVSTAISTDDPDYCWHLLYGGDARGELIGLAVVRDEDGSQPIEFTLLQAITDGLSRG